MIKKDIKIKYKPKLNTNIEKIQSKIKEIEKKSWELENLIKELEDLRVCHVIYWDEDDIRWAKDKEVE